MCGHVKDIKTFPIRHFLVAMVWFLVCQACLGFSSIGPVHAHYCSPVLGQYWASIMPSNGPVLDQYSAQCWASTGPVFGKPSLGKHWIWAGTTIFAGNRILWVCTVLAPQGTNLGGTWCRHRLLPIPRLTHIAFSQAWEILTPPIWGFFCQNPFLLAEKGVPFLFH